MNLNREQDMANREQLDQVIEAIEKEDCAILLPMAATFAHCEDWVNKQVKNLEPCSDAARWHYRAFFWRQALLVTLGVRDERLHDTCISLIEALG